MTTAETIRFICSSCDYRARVPAKFEGKRIKCPACQATELVTADLGPITGQTVAIKRLEETPGDLDEKFRFVCGDCGYRARIPSKYDGMTIKCPGCGTPTVAKREEEEAAAGTDASGAAVQITRIDVSARSDEDDGRFRFQCAGCGYRARLPERFLGQNVKCPGCGTAQLAKPLDDSIPSSGNTRVMQHIEQLPDNERGDDEPAAEPAIRPGTAAMAKAGLVTTAPPAPPMPEPIMQGSLGSARKATPVVPPPPILPADDARTPPVAMPVASAPAPQSLPPAPDFRIPGEDEDDYSDAAGAHPVSEGPSASERGYESGGEAFDRQDSTLRRRRSVQHGTVAPTALLDDEAWDSGGDARDAVGGKKRAPKVPPGAEAVQRSGGKALALILFLLLLAAGAGGYWLYQEWQKEKSRADDVTGKFEAEAGLHLKTQAELQTTKTELQTVETGLSETQAALQTLQEEFTNAKTAFASTKQDLETELSGVRGQLRTASAELQSKLDELAQSQTRLQAVQREAEAAKAKAAEVQEQLRNLQQTGDEAVEKAVDEAAGSLRDALDLPE